MSDKFSLFKEVIGYGWRTEVIEYLIEMREMYISTNQIYTIINLDEFTCEAFFDEVASIGKIKTYLKNLKDKKIVVSNEKGYRLNGRNVVAKNLCIIFNKIVGL